MNALERLKGPIFELFDIFVCSPAYRHSETMGFIISLFAVAVIIFVVFPLRECARGYVAKAMGDDTGEREGRLTLNPFSHIDPRGALMLCITCIGWSRTMPINYNRCTKVKPRTAVVLTSLAGPLSGIIFSYIFLIIAKIVLYTATSEMALYVYEGLYYMAEINVSLAILHLLPIPPFDGCNILCCFLPRGGVMFFERYGQIINLVFFFALILGLLDLPLGFMNMMLMTGLDMGSWFVDMLFLG